ncbi:MAG: RNA polymerase sigma factor [Planctomycetaceae bacterium]|nr:RNA polymerase sigma factor [Planctomycetaceae bacterium]
MDADERTALFTNWLDAHAAAVLRVARAYTLSDEDCQDLAQEILLQAWKSLPQFKGNASPATWFYRVALHTAMNWRRDDQPRRMRQRPFIELDSVIPDDADLAELLQQRETVQRLYSAIHRLPKAEAALVLLYLDDLSYREMGEILGISENNVGVKLNRAKKALSILMNGKPHGN